MHQRKQIQRINVQNLLQNYYNYYCLQLCQTIRLNDKFFTRYDNDITTISKNKKSKQKYQQKEKIK